MGILWMNIISFALPDASFFNPKGWGGMAHGDQAAWLISFIFVESKMRALFSVLFGASMLLFIDGAESAGRAAGILHFRRMLWLLIFGILHYAFIWNGDILTLYALCGLIAWFWRTSDSTALFRNAAICLVGAFILWAGIFDGAHKLDECVKGGTATAKERQQNANMRAGFGEPGSKEILSDINRMRSDYPTIARDRAVKHWKTPLSLFWMFGFETLGFMALGMALLRNGFLTGSWDDAAYVATAKWTLIVPIIAMSGLAWWVAFSGYETLITASAVDLWSLPFRAPMAVGYAASVMLIMRRTSFSGLKERLAAMGQTAFTNYIGTSILMTSLFYGYGGGLFGTVPRAALIAFVVPVWGLMLLWSKPWMDCFHHGPLEWLWRVLTRGEWVALRRAL
jgi:uncharacterized protein